MTLFKAVMLVCLVAQVMAAFCERLSLETREKLNLGAVLVAAATIIILY